MNDNATNQKTTGRGQQDQQDRQDPARKQSRNRAQKRDRPPDHLAEVLVALTALVAIIVVEKGNGVAFGVLTVALVLGVFHGPRGLRSFLRFWKGDQ